jgi:hypothetical protein
MFAPVRKTPEWHSPSMGNRWSRFKHGGSGMTHQGPDPHMYCTNGGVGTGRTRMGLTEIGRLYSRLRVSQDNSAMGQALRRPSSLNGQQFDDWHRPLRDGPDAGVSDDRRVAKPCFDWLPS